MESFHFIRPLWLLAIIVLALLIFLLKRNRVNQSGWQHVIPPHLAKVLVTGDKKAKSKSLTLPSIIGFIAIIAMAGPSWQKLPQPVYQVAQGSVLIMDMSYSMYATDVTPNRLTRARYKAIDLLDGINEGEIGLIAYAGDAFSISPLTDDVNNIKLLLPSLSPDLMPELGSNPLAALTLANDMLMNAGHNSGDIYWFTDGIDNIDLQDITQWSRKHPYRINILGIGTTTGAPIKLSDGKLMKDDNGAIIVPKLTENLLQGVAQRGNGNYATLSNNNSDIEKLVFKPTVADSDKASENTNTGDQWQEFGPYLLLLILPLVLTYFRRGALLVTLPFMVMIVPYEKAYADTWQDLWQTKDQQGQAYFNKDEFQQAAEKFNDPLWQASAHYKAGNYEQALAAYQQVDSAESLYNQGNTLAKLQKFDEAINAYNQALKKDPNLTDAKANKTLTEQLKKQQEQQKQDQQSGDNSQNDDDQSNSENNNENNKQNGDNQSNNGQENTQQEQSQPEQNSEKSDSGDNSSNNENNKSSENQNKDQTAESKQNNDQQTQKNNKENADTDHEKSDEQQALEQNAKAAEQSQNSEEKPVNEQNAQAMQAAEQQAKETELKHQQLLNKVTDDPYLLLRNKMQLEYQKRRQDHRNIGVKKKW